VHNLSGLRTNVEAVAWSPDGSIIAACGYTPKVCLWSADDGRALPGPYFKEGIWRCVALEFLPDGRRLLIGSTDNALRLWDVDRMQEVVRLSGVGRTTGITVPEHQRWVAAAGRYAIRIWDTASPQERVIGETIRRYHENAGGDWPAVLRKLESNVWLTDEQRSEALDHARWLQQLSSGGTG
jgi:WD40 repeat protein